MRSLANGDPYFDGKNMKEINDSNSSAFSYHDANIDNVNTILSPLNKYFFIDSFMYVEFFQDKIFFLSNEKDIMHKLIEFKKFSDSFYKIMEQGPLNVSQLFAWPLDSGDHVNHLFKERGMNNGITIMKKTSNSVKTYGFSSKKLELDLGEQHINHPEIILHFINYFNCNLNDVLKEKQKHLIKFKSPSSHLLDGNGDQYRQKIDRFIKETETKRIYLTQKEDIYLTKREKECLNFILKGKSYKEVARELNISHRTVATHLESIRYKTNLYSKNNLTDFFEQEKDVFCG